MFNQKVNILLVDDHPAKLLSYQVILKELGENLLVASSAQEAFDCLNRTEVAVVLVDVYMPELDGFELARMIREHPRFQHTAIILISAVLQTDVDFLRGYQHGAVDYISVPVIPDVLRAKVKVFLDLYRKTKQLEQFNQQLLPVFGLLPLRDIEIDARKTSRLAVGALNDVTGGKRPADGLIGPQEADFTGAVMPLGIPPLNQIGKGGLVVGMDMGQHVRQGCFRRSRRKAHSGDQVFRP